ncbi:MAG: hypothetical protein U1F65_09930 [Verrucomicrobiota bacterium]
MSGIRRHLLSLFLLGLAGLIPARAQIDPYSRDLVQFGYNGSLEGKSPLAAYMFYYRNQPNFLRTNLTLRLALAPVYLDSELGVAHALGENTDLGLGLAGGGYADSYDEIRRGRFLESESFTGHGGEMSMSVYHCFNPGDQIPLNGMIRGIVHYSTYHRLDNTSPAFELPTDQTTLSVRTGLRWGGKEPMLFPSLAMELSVWYEGYFRTGSERYGFAGDREIERLSNLFWMQALLAYTFPETEQNFFINLTAGSSIQADRFNAYRLGALLPLVSEFPLSLPGYYFNEISARNYVLLGANYTIPLDRKKRWNVNFTGTTALVDYMPGLDQPGNWHSGIGGGLLYQGPSMKVMVGYAYGIDAIRSHGRGAQSVGILMQFDLGQSPLKWLSPGEASRWRGFQKFLGVFGN